MRLRHATTAQDDLSEKLAFEFVRDSAGAPHSGKEVDDFVREFREARKIYHKRVIWGDKWAAGQVQWDV